MFQSYI
jgi:hypothetical protein